MISSRASGASSAKGAPGRPNRRLTLAAALTVLAACNGVGDRAPTGAGAALVCAPGTAPGLVTTLFFGLSRRNRPDVAEAEWQDFLAGDVMTRLSGASVIEGHGLFREAGAPLTREPARLVIVGHRGGDAVERALTEIAERYQRRFDQWGVGRTDTAACTNFD